MQDNNYGRDDVPEQNGGQTTPDSAAQGGFGQYKANNTQYESKEYSPQPFSDGYTQINNDSTQYSANSFNGAPENNIPPQYNNFNNFSGAPPYPDMRQGQYSAGAYNRQYAQNQFYAQYYAQLQYDKIQRKAKKDLLVTSLAVGAATLAMIIIQTIVVVIAQQLGIYNRINSSAADYYLFSTFAVHICSLLIPFGAMSLILKKQYVTELIPRKKISGTSALAWVAFGMGCCMVANYVVSVASVIAEKYGYELTQSDTPQVDSVFACVAEVISVVIAPALIEEFALRCCTLGALRKYGKGFAVLYVSIMFGLIHGNIIQFIFATLVGIILGFITVKTDNVFIAVIVHGCNNALSAISDIIDYAFSSQNAGNSIASAVMMVWLVLSVIGFVYLIRNNEIFCKYPNIPKEYRKQYARRQNAILKSSPYYIEPMTKILCCIPGFMLYAPFFIYAIITTIVQRQ